MTDPAAGLRDSLWYESPDRREWLKTRSPREALRKLERLLALTTFAGWSEVLLELHVAPSPELARLEDYLRTPKGKAELWPWREQPLDASALRAHGVEVDELLADALEHLGAARLRLGPNAQAGDWRAHRYAFWWKTEAVLPEAWLAFCERHLAATLPAREDRPRVELTLRADELLWLEAEGGAPLPFQGASHYPAPPNWRATSWLSAALSEARLYLAARLPFSHDGADFRRYRALLGHALGYELPMTRFRALLVNDEGTDTYARKALPKRPRPPRQPKPGAQERAARRRARRFEIF